MSRLRVSVGIWVTIRGTGMSLRNHKRENAHKFVSPNVCLNRTPHRIPVYLHVRPRSAAHESNAPLVNPPTSCADELESLTRRSQLFQASTPVHSDLYKQVAIMGRSSELHCKTTHFGGSPSHHNTNREKTYHYRNPERAPTTHRTHRTCESEL